MQLSANTRMAKWFVWSCDHLPLTHGYNPDENGHFVIPRKGSHYIANGTTLCHVFWTILWVLLAIVSLGSLFFALIVSIHIESHYEFVAEHPYANSAEKIAAYFFPEMFLLGCATVVLILFLILIGGSKSGFFSLLWQYLKGIKSHICPLVRFDAPFATPAE